MSTTTTTSTSASSSSIYSFPYTDLPTPPPTPEIRLLSPPHSTSSLPSEEEEEDMLPPLPPPYHDDEDEEAKRFPHMTNLQLSFEISSFHERWEDRESTLSSDDTGSGGPGSSVEEGQGAWNARGGMQSPPPPPPPPPRRAWMMPMLVQQPAPRERMVYRPSTVGGRGEREGTAAAEDASRGWRCSSDGGLRERALEVPVPLGEGRDGAERRGRGCWWRFWEGCGVGDCGLGEGVYWHGQVNG